MATHRNARSRAPAPALQSQRQLALTEPSPAPRRAAAIDLEASARVFDAPFQAPDQRQLHQGAAPPSPRSRITAGCPPLARSVGDTTAAQAGRAVSHATPTASTRAARRLHDPRRDERVQRQCRLMFRLNQPAVRDHSIECDIEPLRVPTPVIAFARVHEDTASAPPSVALRERPREQPPAIRHAAAATPCVSTRSSWSESDALALPDTKVDVAQTALQAIEAQPAQDRPLQMTTEDQCQHELRRKGRFRCQAVRCSLGEVLDISASGMRIVSRARPGLRAGKRVTVELPSPRGLMRLTCRVAWIGRAGMLRQVIGLEFDKPSAPVSAALAEIARATAPLHTLVRNAG